MPKNKRLRMFAGPNGSGKTTLFKEFCKNYEPGYFVNADEFEKQLQTSGLLDISEVGVKASPKDLLVFSKTKEAISLKTKAENEGHKINLEIKENFMVDAAKDTHSYEAAYAAAFIRWLLLKNDQSFSCETVMSHVSKIVELKKAKSKDYKTYLYFVCIDNPDINVDRVKNREMSGGHNVDEGKIRDRYPNALKNLYPAIKLSDRTYLFDNSGKKLILIAEIFKGALQMKVSNPPMWFRNHVLPNYTLTS